MRQLAEPDHREEHQADDEHREDDVPSLLGGVGQEPGHGDHRRRCYTSAGGVRSQGEVDRRIARGLARDLLEQACVARVAHRMSCFVEPAAVEQRGRRRPGSAVAVETVCTRLGAEGEQLGEVRDSGHRAGCGDPDEPVSEQGVAEQERDVVVGGANSRARP